MRKLIFTLLLISCFTWTNAQNVTTQQMVDDVSGDYIWDYISELVELDRYSITDNMEAPQYLKEYFEDLGFDTVYFHEYNDEWIPNVVAEKTGKLYPDSVYILGAHYDVYTAGAPGADDNGSGTAGVMEVGRILADTVFDKTIRLICFSGEELGLHGSEAYANDLPSLNQTVVSMINMDMISHSETGGENPKIWIASNAMSSEVLDAFKSALIEYVPTATWDDGSLSWYASASDHASFWGVNVPAIFINDCLDPYSSDFNNFIHTDDDIIGTSSNNKDLAEACVKVATAMLVNYAGLYNDPNQRIDPMDVLNVSLFPNPAMDWTFIRIDENILSCIVMNLCGQVIFNQENLNTDQLQINCSDWDAGMYQVLLVSDSGKLYSSRLVKQ